MAVSLYSSLPSMDHAFRIDVEGSVTGVKFVGDFVYRRPTIKKQADISVTIAKMNLDSDGADLSELAKNTRQNLAWLEHCLIECPDWWRESNYGKDLYDNNVIDEISTKVMGFEEQWTKQAKKPKS